MKAMNCPGPHAGLRQRGAQLPRSAAPLPRADAAAPQRSVGRAVGPDARPAVLAGRCALLRDARSRSARRSSALLRLVQRVYGDFGLTFEAKLSTRPAEFLGEIATWDHAEAALKQALERAGAAVHDQRGRRRVLRPEDRLRHHRRDRPQVAVRDDPARLPDAGALRPEVRRRRQRRAPAGRHPPGDFRQLRAVHRAADRALRRGVPAVAGAGAGRSCCRLPTATSTTRGSVRERLAAAGLRVELDERQEKIGYKIREAQLQKIPYMLVVGDREAAEGDGRGAAAGPAGTTGRRRSTRSSRPR